MPAKKIFNYDTTIAVLDGNPGRRFESRNVVRNGFDADDQNKIEQLNSFYETNPAHQLFANFKPADFVIDKSFFHSFNEGMPDRSLRGDFEQTLSAARSCWRVKDRLGRYPIEVLNKNGDQLLSQVLSRVAELYMKDCEEAGDVAAAQAFLSVVTRPDIAMRHRHFASVIEATPKEWVKSFQTKSGLNLLKRFTYSFGCSYSDKEGRAAFKKMVDCGIDVNDMRGGHSVVHFARTNECIQALSELGAKFNVLNDKNQCPIELAIQFRRLELIVPLAELGVSLSRMSSDGTNTVFAKISKSSVSDQDMAAINKMYMKEQLSMVTPKTDEPSRVVPRRTRINL